MGKRYNNFPLNQILRRTYRDYVEQCIKRSLVFI